MRELGAANERLRREAEEREAAQAKLRESEELYRYTVELSQQLAWTADVHGTTETISARFAEITGTGGTPPHQAWISVVHPDDIAAVADRWERSVRTGLPYTDEFRMRVGDRTYRTFRARAAPRRDEQGRIIRWYGFTEDIEDQRQEQAARLVAEERYRLAARATKDAIWDADLESGEIHWNNSEAQVFGHPYEAITPMSWWEDHVHREDRERVLQSFRSAVAGDHDRWSGSYRFLRGDGQYAEVFDRGFIIRDAQGKALRAVGAMMDITERLRAEAELRRLQAELIHISRLSAMGTMASTLAHELNQPLTAISSYIRGSCRLLEESGGGAAPALEALKSAEAGALRAGEIVRRLRELVSRGTVSVKPERLATLVEEACVLGFVDEQKRGVSHRLELDPDAAWITADRIQVQQVLINLIRNAVQATQGQERREVTIRSSALPQGYVEIQVEDTGSGIAPEVREALFSPFHGTKADGMGIGLSISRTIVEAHGGKISAEDGPSGGAIFRFTLPRAGLSQDDALRPD